MISTDLARLFEMPGPFVSLYLDTTGNLANPQIRVSLRWKSLRHELAHTGAPKAALAAVDPLIDGPHTAGDTLVAIANRDGIQSSPIYRTPRRGMWPAAGCCPTLRRCWPGRSTSSPMWWWRPTGWVPSCSLSCPPARPGGAGRI